MNYKSIFLDTLRLFRESKLLWIFGTFALISEILIRVSVYSIGKHPISCIPYPLVLIAVYFSFLAKAGLIYSANQVVSNQSPTFSEVWDFCKKKAKIFIGLYFISIIWIILSFALVEIVVLNKFALILAMLAGVLIDFFFYSLLTIGICAIVINHLEVKPALWTGLLMVFRNFSHLAILGSILLVLQILLNLIAGNAILGLLLLVPFTVTMALAYQVFITKGSYPALSNIQPTA